MSNALFFISKPLELLGAIEAKTQFDIKNAVLVYSCKKNKDRATIEFLLKKEKIWNTVIFVKPKPYYGLFWVRLIKKLQKEKYTYLFTRAFSTSAYFIHNLEFEKHMLLDDGTATIKIHKEFLKNKNLNKRFSLFGGLNNWHQLRVRLILRLVFSVAQDSQKPRFIRGRFRSARR